MNKPSVFLLVLLFCLTVCAVQAQSPEALDPFARPRVVTVAKPKRIATAKFQEPAQTPARPVDPRRPEELRTPQSEEPKSSAKQIETPAISAHLSPVRIRMRISEAERLMKVRVLPTAMSVPSIDYVTLAALLPESSQIHLMRIAKQMFLARGAAFSATTSKGLPVQIHIVRANGVNTAVTVFDEKNRSLVPLVVEFPIERRGVFRELAYYTSAHPALLSTEVTKAGQAYVNSMIDLAAKRLRDRGVPIAANLTEVAKHLCVVEHVAHDRYRNENRTALFEEIYSLYALNQLDTFRYSVSSAGAGGMVQMIPWAYQLERQRHPGVGLNPDFVLGMRNHGNALEAMLLYMKDTWDDLLANEDVQSAIAAKLPGYIRRGGSAWRTLIPRETQMYLQIYQSLDSLMKAKADHAQARRR